MIRDKSDQEVYPVLKDAYIGMLKMFSTTCPLVTDYIWQNLKKQGIVRQESVHLTDWPKADAKKIDTKLENEFALALEVIEKGLAER